MIILENLNPSIAVVGYSESIADILVHSTVGVKNKVYIIIVLIEILNKI